MFTLLSEEEAFILSSAFACVAWLAELYKKIKLIFQIFFQQTKISRCSFENEEDQDEYSISGV